MALFYTIRQIAHELGLPKERAGELAETYCEATVHPIDGRDPSLRPAVLEVKL